MTEQTKSKSYDRFSNAAVKDKDGELIVLADRNIKGVYAEVLDALGTHSNLTTDDLSLLLKRNKRHLYDVLRSLKANGFIGLSTRQIEEHNIFLPNSYHLAERGIDWLKDHRHNHVVARRRDPRHEAHDGRVSHVLVQLEVGVRATPDYRFLNTNDVRSHERFRKENNKEPNRNVIPHPRKNRIKPDSDLFGIYHLPTKNTRFFVLELDNGTDDAGETIWPTNPERYAGTSFYEKYEAYIPFIENAGYKDKYGLPNFWLFTAWRSEVRMKRAIACLESFKSKAARRILFQHIDPAAEPGYLFTRPWLRAGNEPLFLNQP